MTTRRYAPWLALTAAVLGGLSDVPSARATSCALGHEELELEIRSLEIDGFAQDIRGYAPARLVAGSAFVTLDIEDGPDRTFSTLSQCGAFAAEELAEPTPPEASAACALAGMHCHWPDAGAMCAARCADGSWDVMGCP